MTLQRVRATSSVNNPIDSAREVNNMMTRFKTKREKEIVDINAKYTGEWLVDKREGMGLQEWTDGSQFLGEWRNDMPNGKGEYIFSDGSVFEGLISDGEANGFGKYKTRDGYSYEGMWSNNVPNGFGIEKFPDGGKYEGYFANGIRNGAGTYTWTNNSSYEGNWTLGKRIGMGKFLYCNGDRFIGTFHNLPNGNGVYEWKSGARYHGDFHYGKFNGEGTYIWPDGKSLKARWIDGIPIGKCEYTDDEGISSSKIYDNDMLCSYDVGANGQTIEPIKCTFNKPRLYLESTESFFVERELKMNFIVRNKKKKQKNFETDDSNDSRPTDAASNMNIIRTEGNEYFETKNFDFKTNETEF